MIDMDKMKQELISDEGVSSTAYADTLGYLTIGVGRLVDKRRGQGLHEDEIGLLLQNDIKDCLSDISSEPWFLACNTDTRRRALVNMRFQLGATGIRTFVNSLNLISQGKFKEAGIALRQSRWYQQTPARAERVIRQIEQG